MPASIGPSFRISVTRRSLPCFAWCGMVSPHTGYLVWLGALILLTSAGAYAAWNTRRELGLWDVPLPLALAVILWSTPVVLAMERGNYDLLLLALILPAAW